jgi:hypothetical protein
MNSRRPRIKTMLEASPATPPSSVVDVDAGSRWVVPLLSGHHDEKTAVTDSPGLDRDGTERTVPADGRQSTNQPS